MRSTKRQSDDSGDRSHETPPCGYYARGKTRTASHRIFFLSLKPAGLAATSWQFIRHGQLCTLLARISLSRLGFPSLSPFLDPCDVRNPEFPLCLTRHLIRNKAKLCSFTVESPPASFSFRNLQSAEIMSPDSAKLLSDRRPNDFQ